MWQQRLTPTDQSDMIVYMPEERSAQEIAAEIVSGLTFKRPDSVEGGTTHARNSGHLGGSPATTPSGISRARRREQLRSTAATNGLSVRNTSQANKLLATFGGKRRTDPLAAFLQQIYEANGNVEFYRARVRELHSLYVSGRSERQEVQAVIRLYNDERDRLHKYLVAAARIGLEQRTVKLLEMQAQLIVGVVQGVVDGLELAPEQRARAMKLAADALRSMQPQGSSFTTVVDAEQDVAS